jgi:hypothetical protein
MQVVSSSKSCNGLGGAQGTPVNKVRGWWDLLLSPHGEGTLSG